MKCNTLRLVVLAIGLVSFSASAQSGLAIPVVYFGWDNNIGDITPRPNSDAAFAAFTATLGPYGIDPIDGIPTNLGPFPNTHLDPPLQFSPTAITASTNGVFASDLTPFQNYAIGTKSLVETDANFPFGQMNTIFTFNQPITAFGLYVMQGGDSTNNNPTTFRLRDTVSGVTTDVLVSPLGPGWNDHNIFFLGIGYAVPFNEVTILETDDLNDGMLYDHIVAGTFVPEPGSLVLLTFGGACASALCRKRRFRRG